MKETFWKFSKGKIVWYYLMIIAVGYFIGAFQNTTGDIYVYVGGIIGLLIVPLIVLFIQWICDGKKIRIGKKE